MPCKKILAVLPLLLAACASTQELDVPRTSSHAMKPASGPLADFSAQWRAVDPELSGFYPLLRGRDSFGARLALIERATTSIDAQYFLMKPDAAGLVFADALMRSAARGVRVRVLLDDIFTTVDDDALLVLDATPNVEVRIFNPISRKGLFALNYVGNFKLANRRMHNKLFAVDNQVGVVGGRNIAEEYFELQRNSEFMDFDVLTAGPIVEELSANFDIFWNHPLALPIGEISKSQRDPGSIRDQIRQTMRTTGGQVYSDAVDSKLVQQLLRLEVDPFLGPARVISDLPEKLTTPISREHQTVAASLVGALDRARSEVVIASPYFIPGERGIERISELRSRGVRVMVVTNSLATNNHKAVHAAYRSYRKDLLELGVELFEARVSAEREGAAPGTRLTLHTKAIVIDREHAFIGSLNIDPRSIDINTEMGVLVESRELGAMLVQTAMVRLPDIAYRLRLQEDDLVWVATINGKEQRFDKEPDTSWWDRWQNRMLGVFPERQL